MPLELQEEMNGKLIVVRLTGTLHKEDYQGVLPRIEQAIAAFGKLRFLVVMQEFHGWAPDSLMSELHIDVKHALHVERMAMVGETRWQHAMAVVSKVLTPAQVRWFPLEKLAEARAWVAG